MSAPPSWPPYFFDLADPDGAGEPPRVIVPLLIDWLADEVSHTPDWRIDDGGLVRDSRILRLNVIRKAEGEAHIGFASNGVEGVISLSQDPSGWLGIAVAAGGADVFRAWADRPYEEYELWPPGASEKTIDPPGRMGKKRNWLSIDARAWPALLPLANAGGFVNMQSLDYITIQVRVLNQGTDVWRPVRAVPTDFGFELLAPEGEAAGEEWEFPPGSVVRCEMRELSGKDEVVAVALAE